MSIFQASKCGVRLAVLMGAVLFTAYPLWAQTPMLPRPAPPPVRTAVDLDGDLTAWQNVLVARVIDQADELLGATLQPISDALRAQLALPAGEGLLVASLRSDGPSAQAGLKQNDILLALAD